MFKKQDITSSNKDFDKFKSHLFVFSLVIFSTLVSVIHFSYIIVIIIIFISIITTHYINKELNDLFTRSKSSYY